MLCFSQKSIHILYSFQGEKKKKLPFVVLALHQRFTLLVSLNNPGTQMAGGTSIFKREQLGFTEMSNLCHITQGVRPGHCGLPPISH